MCFRHDITQTELIQRFKMNEESMKGKASSRIAPVEDLEALEPTLLETFQVESTGASISTDCSISLLYRYCEVLAYDRCVLLGFFNAFQTLAMVHLQKE